MKKYFVVETDEVIEFGDVVNLTFFKEIEDGKVTIEKEVEFNEDTRDLMIEMDFVEEREVEGESLIDFEDTPCDALKALEEDFEALEERVDNMEDILREIYEIIKTSAAEEKKEEKKNAQPKKK